MARREIVNRSEGSEIVNGIRLYGLDAEIHRKTEAKRDPKFEKEIGNWVKDVLGEEFEFPDDVVASLRSGILLCRLVNKIRPGIIPRYNTRRIPLLEMENIGLYLKACWELGVPSAELFVTSDLYRGKGLNQVFVNLQSLARIAATISSYKGPTIGPKQTQKRTTKWTGAIKERPALYITDIEQDELRAKKHKQERMTIASQSAGSVSDAELNRVRKEFEKAQEKWAKEKATLQETAYKDGQEKERLLSLNTKLKRDAEEMQRATSRKSDKESDTVHQLKERLELLQRQKTKTEASLSDECTAKDNAVEEVTDLHLQLRELEDDVLFWKDRSESMEKKAREALDVGGVGGGSGGGSGVTKAHDVDKLTRRVAAETAERKKAQVFLKAATNANRKAKHEIATLKEELALLKEQYTREKHFRSEEKEAHDQEAMCLQKEIDKVQATLRVTVSRRKGPALASLFKEDEQEEEEEGDTPGHSITLKNDINDLEGDLVDQMNRCLTRVLFNSTAITFDDIKPFDDVFTTDNGRRQFSFTLEDVIEQIPSMVLSNAAFDILLYLLLRVVQEMDVAERVDHISAIVLMKAASRLHREDEHGRNYLREYITDFGMWQDLDLWEEAFIHGLTGVVNKCTPDTHEPITSLNDSMDPGVGGGVSTDHVASLLSTFVVDMMGWNVSADLTRAFAMAISHSYALKSRNQKDIQAVIATMEKARGDKPSALPQYNLKAVKKAEKQKKKAARSQKRREKKKAKEQRKTLRKVIQQKGKDPVPGEKPPAVPEERPECTKGMGCSSVDPVHWVEFRHTPKLVIDEEEEFPPDKPPPSIPVCDDIPPSYTPPTPNIYLKEKKKKEKKGSKRKKHLLQHNKTTIQKENDKKEEEEEEEEDNKTIWEDVDLG